MMCEGYSVFSKPFSFDRHGCESLPVANLFFSYEYMKVRYLTDSNVEVSWKCCKSLRTKGQECFILHR
jgi:hypothetical protein